MLNVIDRLMLSGPRHVDDPGQVVRLYFGREIAGVGPRFGSTTGWTAYDNVRTNAVGFSSVGAYRYALASTGSGIRSRPIAAALSLLCWRRWDRPSGRRGSIHWRPSARTEPLHSARSTISTSVRAARRAGTHAAASAIAAIANAASRMNAGAAGLTP